MSVDELEPAFSWGEEIGDASGIGWVATDAGYTSSTPPVWSGEDPAAGAFSTEAKVCPNAVFAAFWIEKDGRQYGVHGIFTKESSLPPSGLTGLPRAWYNLPAGEFRSTDGARRITGGRVRVQCNIVALRLAPTNAVVYVGTLHAEYYDGSSATASSSGSTNGGWAFDDGSNTNGSGQGSWLDALEQWITYSNCTAGWVIFEDNVLVCDGT